MQAIQTMPTLLSFFDLAMLRPKSLNGFVNTLNVKIAKLTNDLKHDDLQLYPKLIDSTTL